MKTKLADADLSGDSVVDVLTELVSDVLQFVRHTVVTADGANDGKKQAIERLKTRTLREWPQDAINEFKSGTKYAR